MQINESKIREYAYQIWEAEGKPSGCAEKHWEMACKSLEAEAQSADTDHEQLHGEHHLENFIPHSNSKKGKHAHHPHQPLPH